MESSTQQPNLIIEGVIWKRLLAFFFPVMLGTLFQQLYNTVDAVVVGQFIGTEALAAVGGSASQIMNLMIGFFVGLSSGAAVIVSQFFGAEDADGVSRATHTAIALAIAGGLVLMGAGLALAKPLLRLLNTPQETLADSMLYLRVIFYAMIPGTIYNVGAGIMRAVGDSRRPLFFLIICCLVNIILDLFFVLKLNMGVLGVSVATALSQVISAVLVLSSLMRARGSYRVELGKIKMDGALLKETVRIGLPAGLQSVMYTVSNMIISASINSFGAITVASWVTLGKVDGLVWLILSAFGVSIMTFVGQNYGARKFDRVRKSIRVCIGMALCASLLFSATIILLRRPIFGFFTKDPAVYDIAIQMLLQIAPYYWLFVPIEIISGALRGMGNSLFSTIITAVGICVLRAVWMFTVVPRWHTIPMITVSYPISWVLTALVFIVYYFRIRNRYFPVKREIN